MHNTMLLWTESRRKIVDTCGRNRNYSRLVFFWGLLVACDILLADAFFPLKSGHWYSWLYLHCLFTLFCWQNGDKPILRYIFIIASKNSALIEIRRGLPISLTFFFFCDDPANLYIYDWKNIKSNNKIIIIE